MKMKKLLCHGLILTMMVTLVLPAGTTALAVSPVTVSGYNIYANGNAIILTAGTTTDYTCVYLDNDRDGVIDLGVDEIQTISTVTGTPDANGYDLQNNNFRIYGGNLDAALAGDTKITVLGGKVYGIYAGGSGVAATVVSTSVTVSGGTISFLYCGGNGAPVSGSTSVTVGGGTIYQICGGGQGGTAAVSSTNITVSGGTITNLYGGGNGATVISTNISIGGGTVKGGIDASTNVTGAKNIKITGGSIRGTVSGAAPTKSDGTTPVYKTTLTLPSIDAETAVSGTVTLGGLATGYGLTDAKTTNTGVLTFYLPVGASTAAYSTNSMQYDATVDSSNSSAFALSLSTAPTVTTALVRKSTETQAAVSFSLTAALTGTWKVYDALTGGNLVAGVTASTTGTTLTLTHGTNIPAGMYYVSLTEAGKTESTRLALTVAAPAFTVSGYNIYANGNAIILAAGNTANYTCVYLDNDRDGVIDLGVDEIQTISTVTGTPDANGYDLQNNNFRIYGGNLDAALAGDTKITVLGGKVYGIYAGGSGVTATVVSTSVTVSGGTITYLWCGGGGAPVSGSTSVTVGGGTIAQLIGGGVGATGTVGSTHITINGGTISTLYGGGNFGNVTGSTNITVNNGSIGNNFYGGSKDATVSGNTNITVYGGSISGNIYGGGSDTGTVSGTNIIIGGGTVKGGIDASTNVTGAKSIKITGGTIRGTVSGPVPMKSDGTTPVYKATLTLPGIVAETAVNGTVTLGGLANGYGLTDVLSTATGVLTFYLPVGASTAAYSTNSMQYDATVDSSNSSAFALSLSTVPTVTTATVNKAAATQAAVNFTLTAALTGTWKVYDALTGGNLVAGVTASTIGTTLTLTHGTNIPAGMYYVSLTEAGKTESTRLALTVAAPTYTVTLNTNAATSCAALTSYTYGIGATLPTPTKTGSTFLGWFDNSGCAGTAVTIILTTDTGNKSYWAKWTEPTPAAGFVAATRTLSGISDGMKYSIDGGTNYTIISGSSSGSIVISGSVTAANGIKVYTPGNGSSTEDSNVQTLTITAAEEANAAIAGAKAALDETDLTYTLGEDKNTVKSNVTIPLAGDNGTTLSWVEKTDAGNNITVSGSTMSVTRPSSADGDRTVVITATISKTDGTSQIKDLTLVIKALTSAEEANASIAGAKAALDETDLTYALGEDKNTVKSNVTLPLAGDNGTTLSWVEKTDAGNNITVSGSTMSVTRPSSADGDKTVVIMATISKADGTSQIKDLTLVIKALTSAEEANASIAGAKAALDETDLTYALGEDKNTVKSNVTLPLAGDNGTTLSWIEKTDAGNNITVSGSTMSVTRPSSADGDKTVVITATISKTDGTSETKDLTLVIKALTASSGGSEAPTPDNNGAPVIVNDETYTAGDTKDTTKDGKSVTTVTVDTAKLEEILRGQGQNASVIIPITSGSQVASGVLTGQMVKNMEQQEVILTIQTSSATYTLPASEININAVSEQLGASIALSDIIVEIQVAEPSNDTVKVVENAAKAGDFSIEVPAVNFTIKCTYNNQTVDVSTFNAYVERTIAIPDDADPLKITTGIVVKPDGTTYHVPTRVTIIDGKYYAVINSLTNSTYTVVWHPIEFKDVASSWAKDTINNIGSRMIVDGIDGVNYAPSRDITRAEFAAIVVRALGLESGIGENKFSDVNEGDWYCGYVKTAVSYGIVAGYDDGTFGPNDKITREQAMTMIARAMKITGLNSVLTDSEIDALLASFKDAPNASGYAESSMAACVKAGIVTGRSNDAIAPKAFITRAEVAVIVEKLLQKSGLI